MESSETNLSTYSFSMVGGDGDYSYSQNSTYQNKIVGDAKELLEEAIAENLDLNPNVFCIADLGCSTGPNTFIAVQNIIDAVENKIGTTNFQVFFNDQTENDFNTLFRSLPTSRKYFAAGVPGSFHGPLFPKNTLHFVHASSALHWLSMVPEELADRNSPAWNKGGFSGIGLVEEVTKAYRAQFKNDMDCFLNARAQEVVGGGLMVSLMGGLQDGGLMCKTIVGCYCELTAHCLLDMAKLGLTSKEKVESFALPLYFAPKKELESIIEENGHFSIVKMEIVALSKEPQPVVSAKKITEMYRSVMQDIISRHFGSEIIDKLFELFEIKIEENYQITQDHYENPNDIHFFVMLKRKFD